MNPQHLAGSAEHYTPAYVVEPARTVLDVFHLDPASCREANKVVKAGNYFDQADDGLQQKWHGNVFLNPPGNCGWIPDATAKKGKRTAICGNEGSCSCKLVKKFWNKLWHEYDVGHVEAAVWIGFSLEQLQNLQTKPKEVFRPSPLDFPICYPHKRVAYVGTSPTHASYITLLPPQGKTIEVYTMLTTFERVFAELGKVVIPDNWSLTC